MAWRLPNPLGDLIGNPVSASRARLRAWWHARMPFTDTWTLTQRNVYILPTRAGWMLSLTLLVLLVASINYQLNLGYLLTFLLAGSAVVGMHVCHNTLRGVTLSLNTPTPVFAGALAALEVKLSHAQAKARRSIGLAVDSEDVSRSHGAGSPHWSYTDIAAQSTATVQVAFAPQQRGLHRVPLLTAETRYPLGTFRVWTVWKPAAQVLVYPQPEAFAPPLPPGEPKSSGAAAALRTTQTGEFEGVRAYQRGDPMKLVVWKKAAKSDELVSRDSTQAQRYELWLDEATCGGADLERRLSRLAAWVIAADKLGQDYGLRLGGREISPASGEAHKRQCLEALALHGTAAGSATPGAASSVAA
jgi:uncharacterized protein (DUF58 family)